MSKTFKFFIPCDKAHIVCDKAQYREASLWEKAKLITHLAFCKICRKYTKNNTKLTDKIKESQIQCLDRKDKAAMKKDFEKALKDYSN
ncbi:hypothetical protein ACFFU9_10885 [Mariniflexile ostreae]|uniref:Glycine dehydrogenase n=1 Tax=Mariniflexile ostreae TaxID=1520892 RepID=A0ABV5FD01_9FLAO